ncbi:hypothetical protein J6V85_02390 [Candidatus Saccharibacteria bacterium]|nr:hypothetical protein [Candidatus Saccharibacteria bacterium]
MKKKTVKKFWEIVNYIALVGLVVGQITIGFFFYVGQITFLATDIVILIRSIAIKQNKSDIIKNVCMTAIAAGVLIIKNLGV